MESLWTWLKQANARAVFFCLAAALLGVIGWWGWTLARSLPERREAPAGGDQTVVAALGLQAYLDEQRKLEAAPAAGLFVVPDRLAQESRRNPDKTETVRTQPKTDPTPAKTEPAKHEPEKTAPVRTKDTVTLTYRGMLVRSDGVRLALISDSKSRREVYYVAGTNLFGVTIKSVEPESIGLGQADSSLDMLKRGTPRNYAEGKHEP